MVSQYLRIYVIHGVRFVNSLNFDTVSFQFLDFEASVGSGFNMSVEYGGSRVQFVLDMS